MKADGWWRQKDQAPQKSFLFAYGTVNISDGRLGSAVVYKPNILPPPTLPTPSPSLPLSAFFFLPIKAVR